MFKYSFFFNILSDNRLHCGKRKSKTNYTYVHTYSPLIWQTCINENVGQYIMMDVKWMGKTKKEKLVYLYTNCSESSFSRVYLIASPIRKDLENKHTKFLLRRY